MLCWDNVLGFYGLSCFCEKNVYVCFFSCLNNPDVTKPLKKITYKEQSRSFKWYVDPKNVLKYLQIPSKSLPKTFQAYPRTYWTYSRMIRPNTRSFWRIWGFVFDSFEKCWGKIKHSGKSKNDQRTIQAKTNIRTLPEHCRNQSTSDSCSYRIPVIKVSFCQSPMKPYIALQRPLPLRTEGPRGGCAPACRDRCRSRSASGHRLATRRPLFRSRAVQVVHPVVKSTIE